MLETLGIVQLLSSRNDNAPRPDGDFFGRSLAGRSILEWIVRRVTDAQRLDGVIVLMNDREIYDEWAKRIPSDVPVLLSEAADPLAGAVDALDEIPSRSTVFVSVDTPFVDPTLIDRLVITAAANPQCDYVGYRQRDGRPSVLSQVGVFAEWCTSQALREANRKARNAAERDSATGYLRSHPERFQLRLLSAPAELDREDVRLRVSCEEDWEHVAAIAEAIGEDSLDWQCVAGLLEGQPALRQRMALLNQATGPVQP